MLSVVMLSVVMLSVVMLSVMAPKKLAAKLPLKQNAKITTLDNILFRGPYYKTFYDRNLRVFVVS